MMINRIKYFPYLIKKKIYIKNKTIMRIKKNNNHAIYTKLHIQQYALIIKGNFKAYTRHEVEKISKTQNLV